MRPGRAADHSPPSSAAVMETFTYPLGQTGPVTGSLYLLPLDHMRFAVSVITFSAFFWFNFVLLYLWLYVLYASV